MTKRTTLRAVIGEADYRLFLTFNTFAALGTEYLPT